MGKTTFKIHAFSSSYYPEIKGKPSFWAIVFDTKKEMYEWYLKYVAKRDGDVNKDWDTHNFKGFSTECDFEAMCIPWETVRFDEDGNEERHDYIGNAIFYKGALGAGIVAHEMGHCAFWYERLIFGNREAVFGEEIGDAEERYLHLLHDFVKIFYQKAYKKKLI